MLVRISQSRNNGNLDVCVLIGWIGIRKGHWRQYFVWPGNANSIFSQKEIARRKLELTSVFLRIRGRVRNLLDMDLSVLTDSFAIAWIGSVGEAIFTLGAERNTDKIIGASYAPGFQNLNSYQWAVGPLVLKLDVYELTPLQPDMISFTADPSQTVLSTSYHVIKVRSNT